MKDTCCHKLKTWYSDNDGVVTRARRQPQHATGTFSTVQKTNSQMKAWEPKQYIEQSLDVFLGLPNRLL